MNKLKTTASGLSNTLNEKEKAGFIILFSAGLSLLLLHYLKYDIRLYETLNLFGAPRSWVLSLQRNPYRELIEQLWWWSWHLVTFIGIPLSCNHFFLKQKLSQFGLQLGTVLKDSKWYILLASPIMVFALLASQRVDFQHTYPFYRFAGRSAVDFLAWEFLYLSQFFMVEFFFRGYLVNLLSQYVGRIAIAIMLLPYLMLHFPKPWLEASGALFFGLFLGILALRSRSIWGGVAVHISIALTMDLAAMAQKGQLLKLF